VVRSASMEETHLLAGPPPASLKRLLRGIGVFTSPRRTISGLTGEQALVVPQGAPHSIAQVLAHMRFWQDWMLTTAESGRMQPFPERADTGWPAVDDGEWDGLVEAFVAGLARAEALASDEALLARKGVFGDVPIPGWNQYTVGYILADLAMHNAHHLGQIVLLRRLLGAWPPEGGGVTW
jgi:uncharacterized damage-inducible protein DinB